MTTTLLLLLAASALPASPLEAPPPERARPPGMAHVVQVTGARAYLDAGAEDGLAEGSVLALVRGREEVGRCTVELVAAGNATCLGAGARAGDLVRLPAAPAAAGPKVVILPPLVPDAELERRAESVAMVPLTLVQDKGSGQATAGFRLAAPRQALADVALTHVSWVASDAPSISVERLDASVYGARAGSVSLDLDLRAERWIPRATPWFRPGDQTRLFLWQAQVGWDPGAFSVSAGRVRPALVPGATVLDGAVLGLRREGFEAGLFGGLVPAPDTLSPGTDRATGGLFWALERRPTRAFVVRQEGRLAVVRSPELGTRFELEAAASAHAGAVLDLVGLARLGAGGSERAPGLLDLARVEAGVRPFPALQLVGGFEYGGLAWPDPFSPPVYPGRSRRADLTASWSLLGWLRVGVTGGTARDASSGLDRSWAGPELHVQRLFTPRLSLSAGYLEETGWLDGRSAWVQLVARPLDGLRLIGRVSWMHEAALPVDQDDLGAYLSVAADLTRNVSLRLNLSGRAALAGEGGSTPSGLVGSATVGSIF
jgi:hypothetical protein